MYERVWPPHLIVHVCTLYVCMWMLIVYEAGPVPATINIHMHTYSVHTGTINIHMHSQFHHKADFTVKILHEFQCLGIPQNRKLHYNYD